MVETVRPMRAREAFDWAADYLDLTVKTHGLDAIPRTGACVIIGNHPGGIADGIALWQAIREKRPDLCFLANRDAMRVCPGLEDMLIPVEWRKNERSRANARDTLKGSMEALNQGRCLAIFSLRAHGPLALEALGAGRGTVGANRDLAGPALQCAGSDAGRAPVHADRFFMRSTRSTRNCAISPCFTA